MRAARVVVDWGQGGRVAQCGARLTHAAPRFCLPNHDRYPGPGQYNLLLEHRLEERELTRQLERHGQTVDEEGRVVSLGSRGRRRLQGDDATVTDSDEEVNVLHSEAEVEAARARAPSEDDAGALNVTHVDGHQDGDADSPTPASAKVLRNVHKQTPNVGTGEGEGKSGAAETSFDDGLAVDTTTPRRRRTPGRSQAKSTRSRMGHVFDDNQASLSTRASTAPGVKPLSRAKTRAQLRAARPESTRARGKKGSTLTPDAAAGPPVRTGEAQCAG